MHKVLIIICYAVSVSFSTASISNISRNLNNSLDKNVTLLKTIVTTVSPNNVLKVDHSDLKKNVINNTLNKTENSLVQFQHQNIRDSLDETQKPLPILHRIHARITRSKDAVWATITLTFMCVLLVLAVAQSRMWKDHYYTESQGVPLPNFNEKVLFKDVMEHKISSLKKFFKKKQRENTTELESLLPPSEWDN